MQLDGFQCDSDAHSNPDVSDLFATSPGISTGSNNSTASLNDALRYAIYAYSVRWLPLRSAFESSNAGSAARAQRQQQEVRDQLWRQVRERIFLAISRPSYRSILTLFLFTLTEMPLDNDDPGLGDLCTEVMLNHFIRLRSPFKLPRVSPLAQSTMALPLAQGAVDFIMPRKRSDNDLKYQHLQDSIFWLGVVCDTSRSLIHHSPSVILPGRSGDRKVWGFIRQRTVIFDQSFRVLHGSAQPLPADIIVVVLQHASACKTMYLGVVNQFYEAAFHVNGESVEDAAGRVAEESRRFQDVFDPLLVMCARDYLTMKPESQLHYSEYLLPSRLCKVAHELRYIVLLLTHYHLGTLIFVDALDALDTTPEALKDLKSSRSQACSAIVNALSLAMSCDRYSDDDSPYGSILLLDPTPELMVEVLSRAGKAILSLYQSEKLRLQTAQVMLSVVFSALTVLMKLSVTASFVLSSLHALRSKQNLKIKNDDQCTTAGPIACPRDIPLLSACDSTFIDEFLRESQIQANIDPLHLDRTINKYEDLETRLGGMSGDTTSSQLQMVKDLSPSYAVNCSTVLNKAVWNSRGQCSGF